MCKMVINESFYFSPRGRTTSRVEYFIRGFRTRPPRSQPPPPARQRTHKPHPQAWRGRDAIAWTPQRGACPRTTDRPCLAYFPPIVALAGCRTGHCTTPGMS